MNAKLVTQLFHESSVVRQWWLHDQKLTRYNSDQKLVFVEEVRPNDDKCVAVGTDVNGETIKVAPDDSLTRSFRKALNGRA